MSDTVDPFFTIVIDTREQTPFSFAGVAVDPSEGGGFIQVRTATGLLPSGDYSIEGYCSRVAVERKGGSEHGAADLFGTLGANRSRFVRELERLAEFDYAAVVVESTWEEVLINPPKRSKLNPKTVLRSVIAWQQRYPKVHWWFCPGRRFAEVLTYRILERFWRDSQKSKGGGDE